MRGYGAALSACYLTLLLLSATCAAQIIFNPTGDERLVYTPQGLAAYLNTPGVDLISAGAGASQSCFTLKPNRHPTTAACHALEPRAEVRNMP